MDNSIEEFNTLNDLVLALVTFDNDKDIYPYYDKFLYFYNKYKKQLNNDIFSNCKTYGNYFNRLLFYLKDYLENELENNNVKKESLKIDLAETQIGTINYMYFRCKNKIDEYNLVIKAIEETKKNDPKLFKINYDLDVNTGILNNKRIMLKQLENEKNSLFEDTNVKGLTKLIRIGKKINNKGKIDLINGKISLLEESINEKEQIIKDLENEKAKEFNDLNEDINEFKLKIEKIKQQFKEETSFSMDEIENKKENNQSNLFELKMFKEQVDEIDKKISIINIDLTEINNLINSNIKNNIKR